MNPEPAENSSEPITPGDLFDAFAAVPGAEAAWNNLTPIARRDFTSWINEAKQHETRKRRIARCCENLLKGKRRPCCFAVVPMDFYKALGNDPLAKAAWSGLDANQKRDMTDWIDEAPDKTARKARIGDACSRLATSKADPKQPRKAVDHA